MPSKLSSVRVAGGPVRVVITATESGYECAYDSQRNYGDSPRYLHTIGCGETEWEATRAYIRSCYKLADLPPGTLYEGR